VHEIHNIEIRNESLCKIDKLELFNFSFPLLIIYYQS